MLLRTLADLLLAAACLSAAAKEEPAPQIAVIPTRVVLAEGTRSAAVTLFNRGSGAVACRVSLQRFDMDEAGALHEVRLAPSDPVERQLVVTPSSVRLEPGGSQVFRMLLMRPDELAPGEYRVNLTFVADQDAPDRAPASAPDELRIRPQLGVSVPLIIRHRTGSPSVGIRDLALHLGAAPSLTLKLCRDGAASVFGDLLLYDISGPGEGRLLASRRGIAVYTPLPYRIVDLPLDTAAAGSGARLKAVFIGRDQAVSAESELETP